MTTTTATKFAIGTTYSTRSACDHECIFRFEILARTAKTVTIENHGHVVRRKLRLVDGVETIDPMGRFSMSPVLDATDTGKI